MDPGIMSNPIQPNIKLIYSDCDIKSKFYHRINLYLQNFDFIDETSYIRSV